MTEIEQLNRVRDEIEARYVALQIKLNTMKIRHEKEWQELERHAAAEFEALAALYKTKH
jgi:hypothetical protein